LKIDAQQKIKEKLPGFENGKSDGDFNPEAVSVDEEERD
jgi:hypothetical protein